MSTAAAGIAVVLAIAAFGTIMFVVGYIVGDIRTRQRIKTPTRRPTLIGHRPGVAHTRDGKSDVVFYDPYCACGWKGFTTTDETKARREASDHAKGLL